MILYFIEKGELKCCCWIYPTVANSCGEVAKIINNKQFLDGEYWLKIGEMELQVSNESKKRAKHDLNL